MLGGTGGRTSLEARFYSLNPLHLEFNRFYKMYIRSMDFGKLNSAMKDEENQTAGTRFKL